MKDKQESYENAKICYICKEKLRRKEYSDETFSWKNPYGKN